MITIFSECKCGSDHLEITEKSIIDDRYIVRGKCKNCGSNFKDVYQIKFIERLYGPNYN